MANDLAMIARCFCSEDSEPLKLDLSRTRPGDALLTSDLDVDGAALEGRTGMNAMLSTGRRLLADETGATAIEYALLAACIAMAIIVTLGSLGSTVGDLFARTNDDLITYMPAVGP
jgi:pilus assembly protein Flp/PilA